MALGTTLRIAFDAKKVQRGLANIGKRIADISKRFATFGLKAITTGFAALTAGMIAFTVSASNAATEIESLETQFTTLLGSETLALERMEEITKFAAETPFEIAELANTSKLLQTLGGNLLATGDGLRLVGDAAAMSGRPITEVGLSIGRLFNAVTSGTSAGEAVNRLQELGLITGKAKIGFQELAAAQKKGAMASLTSEQALAALQAVMKQTEGGMEALSKTTEGMKSNMKDNMQQIKVAFGTGFNDGLKVALTAINKWIPTLMERFKVVGATIGQSIKGAVQGDYQGLVEIGDFIGTVIGAAANKAFYASMRGIGEKTLRGLDIADNYLRDQFGLTPWIGHSNLGARATEAGETVSKYETQTMLKTMKIAADNMTKIVPGTDGAYRFAKPGEGSAFSDASGNKIVPILNKIARNTEEGSKF